MRSSPQTGFQTLYGYPAEGHEGQPDHRFQMGGTHVRRPGADGRDAFQG
jgi:hypothetical protein